MSDNVIKYSDFIQPDDSILNIISQLEKARKEFITTQEAIRSEAEKTKKALDGVNLTTSEGRAESQRAAAEARRLARAQKDNNEALQQNKLQLEIAKQAQRAANAELRTAAKLATSAEGSIDELSAQYSKLVRQTNALSRAQREETQEGRALVAQTRELFEELKSLQEQQGRGQINVGRYTESIQDALASNSAFGRSFLELTSAQGGFFNALKISISGFSTALLGLLANPVFATIAGLVAAGRTIKFWVDYNEGLREATKQTKIFTGLAGEELREYRDSVQTVADAFGQDFNEVLKAANSISKNFGISQSEALNLVKEGFIAGADASGEYLQSIKEYPAFFQQAGLSAENFIAILAQTATQGIFSDKAPDSIKEAVLAITREEEAAKEAIDNLGRGAGFSFATLKKAIDEGKISIFEAITQISNRVKDLGVTNVTAAKAITDVFKASGEDGGFFIQNLAALELSLNKINNLQGSFGILQRQNFESQKQLTIEVNKTFEDTNGSWKIFTTTAETLFNRTLAGGLRIARNLSNAYRTFFTDVFILSSEFNVKVNEVFARVALNGQRVAKIVGAVASLKFNNIGSINASFNSVIDNVISDSDKKIKALDSVRNRVKESINSEVDAPVSPTKSGTNPDAIKKEEEARRKAEEAAKGKEAEKARQEREQKALAAFRTSLELRRSLQDANLALEKDAAKKERAQIEIEGARRVEDLKIRLKTEKELTRKDRGVIDSLILTAQKDTAQKLAAFDKTQQEEAQKRAFEALQIKKQNLDLELQAIEENSVKGIELKRKALELEQQIALQQNSSLPQNQQLDETALRASFDAKRILLAQQEKTLALEQFDANQRLQVSEFERIKRTEEEKTKFRLEQEKARLQKVIELNELAGKKLSDNELQIIRNNIARINGELGAVSQQKENRSFDIYSIAGLNLSDEKKQAISDSTSFALGQLGQFMQARTNAANQAVSNADREVQAAQNVLNNEIASRNAGFAANVAGANKELEFAKQQQAKALQEQQKAQKAQENIDTALQASSLITASAKIFSQFGFPFALVPLGLMWGSFAAAKIQAANLTRKNFKDGGYEELVGGSHQSGNDIPLGRTKDGRERRAEGGEGFAIFSKRAVKKYGSALPKIVKSINTLGFERATASGSLVINNLQPTNVRGVETRLDTLAKQGRKETYHIDSQGRRVRTYKNITTYGV